MLNNYWRTARGGNKTKKQDEVIATENFVSEQLDENIEKAKETEQIEESREDDIIYLG